ncbi:MAG: MerC domain-containing protein [Erythrobacter sp.]
MATSLPQVESESPWHRLGIGLSLLCLVHCLALPLLVASLPLVALDALPEALRENEWFHAALIVPVVLVSGPVLLRGHPGGLRTGLVLAGFAALIGALFVDSEAGEKIMTVCGAALLMSAHVARLRAVHRHS